MLVTINTDASFHPVSKHGAYAFWAICNEFRIKKSGVFRDKCINSDDAEARCIVNSLKVVLATPDRIDRIIVNTDSLNAIAILTKDTAHMTRYMGKNVSKWAYLREAYHDTLKNRATVEFRHVKAHSRVADKRSFVNQWCDTEAKAQLRRYCA